MSNSIHTLATLLLTKISSTHYSLSAVLKPLTIAIPFNVHLLRISHNLPLSFNDPVNNISVNFLQYTYYSSVFKSTSPKEY